MEDIMKKELRHREVALYKYNKIRYSFVPLSVGELPILTSDPWSFLSSKLQILLPKKRGNNRLKIERAIYYSGLAEDFYRAANSVPLPAKSALLYYGMLDLVKCYLSLHDVPLESSHEHHGLILPIKNEQVVEVKGKMKGVVNIFLEFSCLLGKNIDRVHRIKFNQALSHVPEIHSIYTSLGHINKRKLLPVDIEFLITQKKDKLYTEISYKKEQEEKVNIEKFLTGERRKYFKKIKADNEKIIYHSRQKKITRENIHIIYKNTLNEYKKLEIVPILTRQGYRYYVDLIPGYLPHLSYTLLAMFYLGGAARYRPLEIKSLLMGELRPLVSEFVSLSPKQFLYQMVSLITSKECLIPFASI
uniref:YaaC-like Protein n=1 Tax=Hahella chejuensis TaxID=158327 RepID=W6JRZ0_9GAMM|nr:hypothetical protein [Hahella chejuensis]